MGNADEHLKTIANVVTDDLFNDGLAKAFNQLFELDLNIK
jgi:hydroxymethylpyrimidine pyrophosphatase-like HAD family hydrolase